MVCASRLPTVAINPADMHLVLIGCESRRWEYHWNHKVCLEGECRLDVTVCSKEADADVVLLREACALGRCATSKLVCFLVVHVG